MSPLRSSLIRLAGRFNMTGAQVLAWYTAGVVTALLLIAVYQEVSG